MKSADMNVVACWSAGVSCACKVLGKKQLSALSKRVTRAVCNFAFRKGKNETATEPFLSVHAALKRFNFVIGIERQCILFKQ